MQAAIEHYDILVLGSGEAGKYIAWTLARAGRRAAVVERGMIGGSCPNVACLPSKNVIYSARVAALARRGAEFGISTGPVSIDMRGVRRRKRQMVDDLVAVHRKNYADSGAELIIGEGRFVAAKTIEVRATDGAVRRLAGERVFIDVGTRAAIPDVPGMSDCKPLTHVEALELDHVPEHLVVLGGGYVGLEFAQPMRRFGARVTVLERGPQLAAREDPDVAEVLARQFADEGIEVVLGAETLEVAGRSGAQVRVRIRTAAGERTIEGSDLLVAAGRVPNTADIGLDVRGRRDRRARVREGQRAPRDHGGGRLGRGRLRGQPAVHACRLRRLPHRQGQPGRRRAHDARPAGPLLHVHRPRAGSRRPERIRRRSARALPIASRRFRCRPCCGRGRCQSRADS